MHVTRENINGVIYIPPVFILKWSILKGMIFAASAARSICSSNPLLFLLDILNSSTRKKDTKPDGGDKCEFNETRALKNNNSHK
jgi:hypothetical protein